MAWLKETGYTKEKSNIVVIGLSVHTIPVEMHEKLAVPETEWPRAIAELCSLNHIEEAAVLSTCNRDGDICCSSVSTSWYGEEAVVLDLSTG
ncbi:hypothetical protein LOK49_Contig93G00005 [Camellia lanceoleosa]|nr:hypothetical protein LOK49_Contig93G00005 [Camellia lanceoleosa]